MARRGTDITLRVLALALLSGCRPAASTTPAPRDAAAPPVAQPPGRDAAPDAAPDAVALAPRDAGCLVDVVLESVVRGHGYEHHMDIVLRAGALGGDASLHEATLFQAFDPAACHASVRADGAGASFSCRGGEGDDGAGQITLGSDVLVASWHRSGPMGHGGSSGSVRWALPRGAPTCLHARVHNWQYPD